MNVDKQQMLINQIREFNKVMDWDQFHTPENLAKSISIEAGELLECFQWSNEYKIEEVCEELAKLSGVKFLYRDFRVGFREGQAKAREAGLYMQKYCGCIFSEEERYKKQIEKDLKNAGV